MVAPSVSNIAALNPAKLARGVADAAERRGASIYEQTTALAVEPGRVRTSHGSVRAPRIVMALDAHATLLPGGRRNADAHLRTHDCHRTAIGSDVGRNRTCGARPLWRRTAACSPTRSARRITASQLADATSTTDYGSVDRSSLRKEPSCRTIAHRLLARNASAAWRLRRSPTAGVVCSVYREISSHRHLDRRNDWNRGHAQSYTGEGVCPSNLAGRTLCDYRARSKDTADRASLGRPPIAADGSRNRFAGSALRPRLSPPHRRPTARKSETAPYPVRKRLLRAMDLRRLGVRSHFREHATTA